MNSTSALHLSHPHVNVEVGRYYVFARRIAIVGSAIAAVIGIAALFACWLDIKSMRFLCNQVVPEEAVGFFLIGSALLFTNNFSSGKLSLSVSTICCLLLAALAFGTVSEYFFHTNFGFYRQLSSGRGSLLDLEHSRMSFQSSMSFALLAGGVLCIRDTWPRLLKVQQAAALTVLLCAAAAMLGHLYRFPFLSKIACCSEPSPISAYTMTCAATALFLSRPLCGPAAVFTSSTLGGVIARRLLPFLALMIATFATLHVCMPQSELFVYVVCGFFVLPILIWIAAAVLDKVTLQKELADSDVRELNRQLNGQVKELLTSHQQINEALEARSEFLAKVSHELRTPLTGIISTTEMLLTTPLASDQKELADITLDSGDQLLKMINEILDFSKIDAHKIVVENIDVDLFLIITLVLESLKAKSEQKGLSLVSGVGPGVPRVIKGDPGRIRQVLVNLLDNAIKFTHEGQVVLQLALRDGKDKQELLFIVKDSGIGISAKCAERLFQPFVQADGSTTRRYGGTGLGLSICKGLTELMGGSIGINSAMGSGSEFWFTIPLERSSSLAAPFRTATNLQAITTNIKKKLVLVAEDNPVNAKIVTLQLSKLGYMSEAAKTGKEAVESSDRKNYDLILMDVQMPDMDGLEASRNIRLREIRTKKHVPIIALTAHAMSSDREKCLLAGMDDYMAKPPALAVLSAVLKRWIGIGFSLDANGNGAGENAIEHGDGNANGNGDGNRNGNGGKSQAQPEAVDRQTLRR